MGFGGSALALAQTLKNNAKQLAKRDKYFEKGVSPSIGNYGKIVAYKKMSPEQFKAFKLKLRQNELRRQKNLAILFGGLMLIIISILIYFLFFH